MQENEQIKNSGRRRLAKGVLAGPAVLASITSKNALGASYACAVSGQQSGNLSRGAKLNESNCTAGFTTRDQRKALFAKDATSQAIASPMELGVNYRAPTASARTRAVRATSHQIYENAPGLIYTKGGDNQLLQAALTVYLNALEFGSNYHIKSNVCLDVFAVAAGTGTLSTGQQKRWDSVQCGNYLKTLAGMGSFSVD